MMPGKTKLTYQQLESVLEGYDFRILKKELQLIVFDNVSESIVATIHRLEEGILDTDFPYSLDNDKTTRGYLPFLYAYAMTDIHKREEL